MEVQKKVKEDKEKKNSKISKTDQENTVLYYENSDLNNS